MSRVNPPEDDLTIDISGANQTILIKIAGIYCNVDGTVYARLKKSATVRKRVVKAGSILLGDFGEVGNAAAGTTLTAAGDMIALINFDE